MRVVNIGIVLVLGLCVQGLGVAAASAGDFETEGHAAWFDGDDATLAIMEEPISLQLDAVPLKEAIDAIFEDADINVFVNWTALDAGGYMPENPVTVDLDGVSREQALDEVIRYVTAPSVFDLMDYSMHRGLVHISLQGSLAPITDRRSYAIGQLLPPLPIREPTPDLESGSDSDHAGHAMCAHGPSIALDVELDALIELIRENAGRLEDWAAYGGDVAGVRALTRDHLIIQATPEMHREVEALLGSLRQQRIEEEVARLRAAVDD